MTRWLERVRGEKIAVKCGVDLTPDFTCVRAALVTLLALLVVWTRQRTCKGVKQTGIVVCN